MASVLSRKVLVLNKSWCAIGVVDVERAVTLLSKFNNDGTPKAEVIDASQYFRRFTWSEWSELKLRVNEQGITSPNCVFRIPEVIFLPQTEKMPHMHKISFSRKVIYKRDNYTCQYCGKHGDSTNLNIDHVFPRSLGGKTTWENCVLSCIPCNSKKADRTLKQCGMKLLKQPTKPKFNFFKGDIHIESWKHFLDAAYWNVELDNDNK